MLSVILSQADSNKPALANRQDLPVAKFVIKAYFLIVCPHAALLDEAPSLMATFGQAEIEQRALAVGTMDIALLDVFGNLTLPELGLEVRLGSPRGLLPMQPLHELSRRHCRSEPPLQSKHHVDLAG